MFDTSLGGAGDRFPRLEAIDAWTLEKATSPAREAVGFVHPLMQHGLRPSNVSVGLCILLRELCLSAALHGEYLAPVQVVLGQGLMSAPTTARPCRDSACRDGMSGSSGVHLEEGM
jgi:hypothetical protein